MSLTFVSDKISLVGMYHKLKSPTNPKGESLTDKIIAIYWCNFALTYPFAFSYFYLIRTTVSGIDINDASILSLLITLATLLVLRILANPNQYTKPNICNFYDKTEENDLIDLHRERVLSLFYAFICTTIILGFIYFSYNLLMNIQAPLGTFNFLTFMEIVIIYFTALFSSTLLGELILKCYPPIKTI
jgi:hypothetical protein